MIRFGVFGGTFDPPHNAHYSMSKKACELYKLDRLIIVPTFQSPMRDREPTASPQQRVEMLKLLIKKETDWIIDRGEIDTGIAVPTIQTLTRLQSKYQPDELYLIIGADQGSQFHLWQSADEIIGMAKVVCFARKSYTISPKFSERMLKVPYQFGVSSSVIRELAKANDEEIPFTVPDVADYIRLNQLYK